MENPSPEADNVNPSCDKVWKYQGPNRNRAFFWKLSHARLVTNEEREIRHMSQDDLCVLGAIRILNI